MGSVKDIVISALERIIIWQVGFRAKKSTIAQVLALTAFIREVEKAVKGTACGTP